MAGDPVEEFYKQWQLRKTAATNGYVPSEYSPVIWAELAKEEWELAWLVEGFWPTGKHVHLFAAHKTGKSLLSLWVAVSLAIGRDPFTGAPIPKRHVSYFDWEMTRQDLQERLFDMGLANAMEAGQLEYLHYHLYPPIGFLDTQEGGIKLLQWVNQDGSDVVVLDTLSRTVKGEENSNDTYRDFFNFTGAALKARNVAMLRLDHEGHQEGKSRGASSKADDVDLVYQLKQTDEGLQLVKKFSRIAYVSSTITLTMDPEQVGFTSSPHEAWPAGTKDRADELDALGVPDGLSVRKVQAWLREHDHLVGKTTTLLAAIKYRNQRVELGGK